MMTQKVLAFIITFLILGGVIYLVKANDFKVPLNIMDTNQSQGEREVKNLSWSEPPEMALEPSVKYIAEMETSKGKMVFELFAEETPVAVNNFVFLANNDFYQNTFFHRIIEGFMIQGGDPTGTGMGGPGYSFNDEPVTRDYKRGVLAMANSGPNTNGSQFFVMHQDVDLPKDYVVFGKLIEGGDVLDAIAGTPVKMGAGGEESEPVEKIYVDRVEIKKM